MIACLCKGPCTVLHTSVFGGPSRLEIWVPPFNQGRAWKSHASLEQQHHNQHDPDHKAYNAPFAQGMGEAATSHKRRAVDHVYVARR